MRNQERSFKPILLLALALALAVYSAVHFYTYTHLEDAYAEDLVEQSFLSMQRDFSFAARSSTEKHAALLETISHDKAFERAMLSGNQKLLLRIATPVFDNLRKEYGITHFYFMRPNRAVFLRVHQPERSGDVIDRYTAKQAEATGKRVSGFELGPLGTFTLRTVIPWRDGDRLIGYLELGEEIEHILGPICSTPRLGVYATIFKRYLTQNNWMVGNAMLNRHPDWDFLPDSVITFQTMQSIPPVIRDVLSRKDSPSHVHTEVSGLERDFRISRTPLNDAAGRTVGEILLLRDLGSLDSQKRLHMTLEAGFQFVVGGLLFLVLYLVVDHVEKRLKSSQAEIEDSEARFRSLVESSSDWIWEVDANARYVYASPKLTELLGYAPDEVIGKTPFDLMPAEEVKRIAPAFENIIAARKSFTALENINLHKDGHRVVLESSGVPILDHDGNLLGYRGMDRDITERKQMEEQVRQLAFHDQLTQLPNRRLLDDRLRQAMNASKRSGCYGAVMFLDLDNFKPLNDAYGHDVGDLLLVEVAQRLISCVRKMDTVARFGGDEFVVLLNELDVDKDKAGKQALAIAEKIQKSLATPYMLTIHSGRKAESDVEYHCTATIGVALFIGNDATQEDVLKWADTAMYQSKESGRNSIRLYGYPAE